MVFFAEEIPLVPHVEYKDRMKNPRGYLLAQEQFAREYHVAVATKHVVATEIGECYRTHGVNHFVECKSLREEYKKIVTDPVFGILRVSSSFVEFFIHPRSYICDIAPS